MRPVIKLKVLNQYVGRDPLFQDERFNHSLRPAKAGRWIDLKDIYLTVPVNLDHQLYSRFTVEGIDYQSTCLPLSSMACAPWAFTKIMKAVVTLFRSWGTKIIVYINDILSLHH